MRRKNPAAVALAKKRWKGTSPSERSEHARAAVAERWDGASEEEKLAVGQRLAEARAAARKRRNNGR